MDQDLDAAVASLIAFAAQNGFIGVAAGKTTRGVTDRFELRAPRVSRFADGRLEWAWLRSVTRQGFSCAISFKPGQGKVVSYGNKYGAP